MSVPPIPAGIGTDALHGDRIAEGVVSGRGERAARLPAAGRHSQCLRGDGLALDDDGAVQVFAALRGQIQAVGHGARGAGRQRPARRPPDGSPSRCGCRRSRSWSSQSRRSDRDAALLFQSVLLRPVRPVCRYPQAWMGSPFIRAARCVRSSSVNSAIPATRPTAACGRFVVTADSRLGA